MRRIQDKLARLTVAVAAAVWLPFWALGQQMTGYEILQKFITTNRSLKGVNFTLTKWDRFNGKMLEAKMDVKLNCQPHKVYLKRHYPDKGLEVLYVEGQNKGLATINAGSLIPTLSLDPMGSRMRENEHHTIHSMGFSKLANILEHLSNKYKASAETMITFGGETTDRGRKVYRIELNNPNFKYIEYTVQAGEDLVKIARRFMLSEHMILEKNKLSSYTAVRAGQKILIPCDYAKRTVLFIDKELWLPTAAYIFDDQGEYEKFWHDNIRVNPTFAPDEFSTSFKGYGF
jgi:outer membrane lipoprotein-sorting protein